MVALVFSSEDGASIVARALRNPVSPRARRVLLGELARSLAPDHPHITLALGDLLRVDDPSTTIDALRALGATHSRQAVGLVMGLLVGTRGAISPEMGAQAIATLERQTGKSDLSEDPGAWSRWWQTAQFLPEAEWRAQLARDQAKRADSLQHEHDQMLAQMVELHRRLHLLSTEDERPRILAALIESEITPLKILGLQLTERRLLNARPIDDTIILALTMALSDADPLIRAGSSSIIARLGTAESTQKILAALLRETDDAAAAALLRAAARHPQPAILSPALQWLEQGQEARAAAVETLNAVIDSGGEISPAQAARARAILEVRASGTLSEPEMALLIELDRTPIVLARLRASDTSEARAAARVLSNKGVAIDALVRAARDNLALRTEALNALSRHRRDLTGLEMAMEIADPSDPIHRSRVLVMARALEPVALLHAALAQPDPARREMFLQPAGEVAFFTQRRQPVAQVEAVIALARLRIDMSDLAAARAGLTQLPSQWRGPRIDALEIELGLLESRYDEASARTVSAALATGRAEIVLDPWMRVVSSPPPAAAIDALQAIVTSLADVLSSDDLAQLERLIGRPDGQTPSSQQPLENEKPPRVEAPGDSPNGDHHED